MPTANHSISLNSNPGNGEIVVLFCGNSQTHPLHTVGPQVLDYYLLHFVQQGCGQYSCLGRDYSLKAGDSFIIFPGELHAYESDVHIPWLYRWVGFKGTLVEKLLSQMQLSAYNPVVQRNDTRSLHALFLKLESALKTKKAHSALQAEAYMRLILAEFGEGMKNPSPAQSKTATQAQQTVEEAISWLTLQYSNPISIDDLSQSLGYHRTYFSRIFKKQTGMSPSECLLKIRMERAKLLIMQSSFSIEHIASSVGYTDPLYFSKQFKKWHGQSPRQYRHTIREKNVYDCREMND